MTDQKPQTVVYVLGYIHYDDHWVYGVFSDSDKAERVRSSLPEDEREHAYIAAYEVDKLGGNHD